MDGKIDEREVS